MPQQNQQIKTLFIKKLTKEDNEMLLKLREATRLDYNTAAVLKACYLYLELLEKHSALKDERETQEQTIARLTLELDVLKGQIRNFFDIEKEQKAQRQLLVKAAEEKQNDQSEVDTDAGE
ncbi:MAG: hypothetical protein AAF391_10400 [Bacteroidota bacterium]